MKNKYFDFCFPGNKMWFYSSKYSVLLVTKNYWLGTAYTVVIIFKIDNLLCFKNNSE